MARQLCILFLLWTCSFCYGLEAPYLISATALSDSSVELTWRNNDVSTQGFIIQRRDSAETSFKIIDSVQSADSASYVDTKNLQPLTLYTYQIAAYTATSVSVPSNTQQATTLARTEVFTKPGIKVHWDYDTSKSVDVTIFDSSNNETGYRIYRDERFAGDFRLLAQVTSANPAKRDSIVWHDTSVTLNNWYGYKVAAHKDGDSVFSEACSTFTFRGESMNRIVTFERVADFPITLGGWSAKSGDSLFLKEPDAPAGMFSVINVKDVARPEFEGYMDSSQCALLPQSSLIPAFLRFGIYNSCFQQKALYRNGYIWYIKDSILFSCDIEKNIIETVDTSSLFSRLLYCPKDSVLLYISYHAGEFFYRSHGMIQLTDTSYTKFPRRSILATSSLMGSNTKCFFDHGSAGNKILVSFSEYTRMQTSACSLMVDEPVNGSLRTITFGNGINAWNTGVCVSDSEYICFNGYTGYSAVHYPAVHPKEMFVLHPADPHGRDVVIAQGARYIDSATLTHAQNILVDTLKKNVFLFGDSLLTIFSYNHALVGVARRPDKPRSSAGRCIVFSAPFSGGVTIILPFTRSSSSLFFYDLSGRLIDKMHHITSNAVFWRPRTRSRGCYFVVVKSGGERFVQRFIFK